MNEKHSYKIIHHEFDSRMNVTPGRMLCLKACKAGLMIAFACAVSFAPQASARSDIAEMRGDSLPSGYEFGNFSDTPLPPDDNWWESFNDPSLTRLVTLVEANNHSLKGMLKRIDAARQILRQTNSAYFPEIGLSAGYDIGRNSGREVKPYGPVPTTSAFSLGASLSWEIDVFGKVREKAESDKATIEASRYEYDGMLLTLRAEVASYYSAMRMYEEQLKVARNHLETQEYILNIAEVRFKAGLVSKLDVVQARSVVSTTKLMIPELESEADVSRNALATLCGVTYQDIKAITANHIRPALIPPDGIGIPADLIRRRPDIAQAEMQIESLAARLGVARKEYLPSLTLNASIGTSAHDIDGLFRKNSLSYSLTPTLSWTVFDGFGREAMVKEARLDMEAKIEDYNQTLFTAVREVENAMAKYEAARSQLGLYDDVMATSRELVDLALERYRHGLSAFTDVAGAQVTYLTNRTNYEVSRANCFVSLINLYKALGGGFER